MVKTRSSTRSTSEVTQADKELSTNGNEILIEDEDEDFDVSSGSKSKYRRSKNKSTDTPTGTNKEVQISSKKGEKRKSHSTKKSLKKKPNNNGSILTYFKVRQASPSPSTSSDSPVEEQEPVKKRKICSSKKAKKIPIDPLTRAFLDSGVPDVVLRAKEAKEENGEEIKPTNKRKSRPRRSGTILSYFRDDSSSSCSSVYSSSRSPSPSSKKGKKIKVRIVDPQTRAFLDSGVPDIVIKAQKVVEKKKCDDNYLNVVGFFPKIQSVNLTTLPYQKDIKLMPKYCRVAIANDEDDTTISFEELKNFPFSSFNKLMEPKPFPEHICCLNVSKHSISSKDLALDVTSSSTFYPPTPWIEAWQIDGLKNLACDKEGLSKLTVWLKQWKADINDDGGTSRKIEVKKKRHGSEDEFVTSEDEEEGELKKKSVLLIGPPGSGKTAAVYTTAKHYGFHVVEVNFSSRRSGKEVLQNVEEAVLSHRLKASHNCLLLFEDIDLLDSKEDEGFHSAVAQLITTAVRPIVMTCSNPSYISSLDSKLEKKDPLLINFQYPKSSQIVRKVLNPLMKSMEVMDDANEKKFSPLLNSIVRHGGNDIRQTINQIQFLFTFSPSSIVDPIQIHTHCLNHASLVHLNHTRPTEAPQNKDDSEDEDIGLSVKTRQRKCLDKLESLSESLGFLCDLDLVQTSTDENYSLRVNCIKRDYLEPNFCSSLSTTCGLVNPSLLQSLVIDSDAEIERNNKAFALFDEIGEYCDNIYGNGGWDSAAYVRTIIKRNMINSLGRLAKRNGRVTSYFNRLDRNFTDRICNSLGFQKELETVKEVADSLI